ncbi:MAG TPA: hypothetical protein VKQ31_07010, partial [Steroidobacteraceae bacterium]|nr:hypothetical protein [Steroidobacteraceae bacterium]
QRFAAYRSRATGAWSFARPPAANKPVSDDPTVDAGEVQRQLEVARLFIARLPVNADCVILTVVPTVKTRRVAAEALAAGLGMPLIAPDPEGLVTFDGSHLEPQSAVRFARAFFAAAGPRLQRCLDS